MTLEISRSEFGVLRSGEVVEYFRLENEYLELSISNYGCRVLSVVFKPPQQQLVMGQWSLPEYETDATYSGAVIGRTTNRVNNAQFTLEGERYQLEANEPPHQLHGGFNGFHNRCWQPRLTQRGITFETNSMHGEGGYPGNVRATVDVGLVDKDLVFNYAASTDRPTYFDMTNHSYFCLDDSGSILEHELVIRGSQYLPVDDSLIPTGEILSCSDTPFDFSEAKLVGKDLQGSHPQLRIGHGYDHSFVLDRGEQAGGAAAELYSPLSNMTLQLVTDAPALQLYSGNHLPVPYRALCLETQHFPNACNQAGFRAPLVTPDQPYVSQTSYRFGLRL